MITIRLNKFLKSIEFKLFESIDDLPAENYSYFNKYLLIDSGIGSDFTEIDTLHLNTISSLIKDPQKLAGEVQNLRSLVWNIINGVNLKHLAFGCLIHSVDGRQVTDLSADNLKSILKTLSEHGLTEAVLKKKLLKQGRTFTPNSPSIFPSVLTTPTSTTIFNG
jgi:hypothetical protein